MEIELTDDEITTILVALDNYGDAKRLEWAESRDDATLTEAGSAEWCWQKLFCVQQQFRNAIADAIGEGETTNNESTASVDPFNLNGLEY